MFCGGCRVATEGASPGLQLTDLSCKDQTDLALQSIIMKNTT